MLNSSTVYVAYVDDGRDRQGRRAQWQDGQCRHHASNGRYHGGILVSLISPLLVLLLISTIWLAPTTWNVSIACPYHGPYEYYDDHTKTGFSSINIPGLLLPHGDFAYDPTLVKNYDSETQRAARQVAFGARHAAASFRAAAAAMDTTVMPSSSSIMTIVLVTPHGIQLDDDFGIYLADTATGTAEIGQDLPCNATGSLRYNLTISNLPLDLVAAQDLVAALKESNHKVQGIHPYNDISPMPLNWGEIIPLALLLQNQTTTTTPTLKFIILSMPHRRYQHAADTMIPELLKLGAAIAEWMTTRTTASLKFGVLISGDLSHTHQRDGPYGYSNTSGLFDAAMGDWAMHPFRNEAALLERGRTWQPTALSCGFAGFVLWQGMLRYQQSRRRGRSIEKRDGFQIQSLQKYHALDRIAGKRFSESSCTITSTSPLRSRRSTSKSSRASTSNNGKRGKELEATLYVNRNVTYYGMMAATFLWTDEENRNDNSTLLN